MNKSTERALAILVTNVYQVARIELNIRLAKSKAADALRVQAPGMTADAALDFVERVWRGDVA